jgi:uncharacterized protein YegP (UPF0339 family)
MGTPKITIYQDTLDQWRWSLVAGNGEIVAQGESHTTEADARRAALRAGELLAEAGETLSFEQESDPHG